MTESITSYLETLGMNKYEQDVFIYLLYNGTRKATEIADHGKVPRSRIYDILAKMVRDSLVSRIPSEPAMYCLVDPEVSLARFIDEYNKKTLAIGQLKKRLVSIAPNNSHLNSCTFIQGAKNVTQVHKNMINTVEKELSVITGHYMHDKILDRMLCRITDKGVSVKVAMCMDGNPDIIPISNSRVEMRHIPFDPKLSVWIADDKTIMLAWKSNGDSSSDTGIQITNPAVQASFKNFFGMFMEQLEEVAFEASIEYSGSKGVKSSG